jgi:repressor LexA
MKWITPKQKQVLTFIHGYREEHGYSPTQQEIARQFGFSSLGTVQNYLTRLQDQGHINKSWNGRRAIEVIKQFAARSAAPTEKLPLLGRVAAGRPIEAIEVPDTISVPSSMYAEDHFVLKVEGNSMVDDGILNGDFVVIKKQPLATNGQTVVAIINGEATVKRFHRKGNLVELHPANPACRPIIVDHGDFRVEGIVVGVIRHYR